MYIEDIELLKYFDYCYYDVTFFRWSQSIVLWCFSRVSFFNMVHFKKMPVHVYI